MIFCFYYEMLQNEQTQRTLKQKPADQNKKVRKHFPLELKSNRKLLGLFEERIGREDAIIKSNMAKINSTQEPLKHPHNILI